MSAVRLASYFDYGTRDYPPKVARRLRATNITAALITAAMIAFQLLSPGPPDNLTLVVIAANAAVPLLHRFGSAAAPLGLMTFAGFHVVRVILEIGTGDGIYLALLSAAPLSILLFGLERLWLAGLMSVVAAALASFLYVTVPAETGMVPHAVMQSNFVVNFCINAAVLFGAVTAVARIAARAEEAVERERERSERLLLNILPGQVALRLKEAPDTPVADRYDAASVLFADMAGFTERASETEPEALVAFLNDAFRRFDRIVAAHGLEKVKTLGDGYMVVAGVPVPRPDHAEALARAALELRDAAGELSDPAGRPVEMRIGLATGPVVAGVIGSSKFFYDVWGDAVNMAARMEATGVPGRIHVAPGTARLIAGKFALSPRGVVEVKGKGAVETWFLDGAPAPSLPGVADAAGFRPA